MAEAVVSEHQISLNSVRYPLVGRVVRGLSNKWPDKTVIGDYTKDSNPTISTLALSDHRGGIGLDIMEGQGDTQVVEVLVPLAEVFGYATSLRSITQGRATYSMEFSHYQEVSQSVAQEVLSRA